jgi:AcrR family transcriptional regulator
MGKKRGPYSSKRQIDRRLRILRVTAEHLEKYGESSLTMQAIAEISEVSTKTVYNLFGSRDLLLMEAASERLVDLGLSDYVLEAEEGLPRLLAFAEGSMKNFVEMPQYARAVISVLVRADLPPDRAFQNFGVLQRFAQTSLELAASRGELRAGLDVSELANHIATNQWGAVLWWEKGLIELEQLENHVSLSHYATLIPVCLGERRKHMEAELEHLLASKFTRAGSTESPVIRIGSHSERKSQEQL